MVVAPRRRLIPLLCFALSGLYLVAPPLIAQKNLAPAQAKNHVGETSTVCGQVASTRYAASTRGRPTFLNLEKPYPDQIFTVLVWGKDRSKFGAPESAYKNKTICVTGEIAEYRGVPEIIATEPRQIEVRPG